MEFVHWPRRAAAVGMRQWPTVERLAGFVQGHASNFAAAGVDAGGDQDAFTCHVVAR